MKQKFKLELIDTDKPSNLFVDKGLMYFNIEWSLIPILRENKLLVALSDEKIKDGDWFYNKSTLVIGQRTNSDDNITDWSGYGHLTKIVASNSKELTPTALFDNDCLESYAKEFNKGNAPEWIELEMKEYINTEDVWGIIPKGKIKIKTSNNYVIVAEQEKSFKEQICTTLKVPKNMIDFIPKQEELNIGTSKIQTVVIDMWSPSVRLRWKNYGINSILQQLYTSNLGKQEWRDIEIVN